MNTVDTPESSMGNFQVVNFLKAFVSRNVSADARPFSNEEGFLMEAHNHITDRPQRQVPSPTRIPLLVYHKINSDSALNCHTGYSISAEKFERQMQYLYEQKYQCLNLSTFLQIRYDTFHPLQRAFVLTFDDGYEDFLTNAFPILARYEFTATVFLATNWVGSRNLEVGATALPLTWDQVETLRKAGITFGSHTCNHPRLLSLSKKEIWNELTASKEELETRLGEEIQYMAYPYGESNEEIQAMAEQAGYQAACGVITGRDGKYNLWRIPFESRDSMRTFALKLTNWYNRLLQFRRWAREDTSIGRYVGAFKHRQK